MRHLRASQIFGFIVVLVFLGSLLAINWPDPAPVKPASSLTQVERDCLDDEYSYAYMVRRPKDPHSLEYCEHIARRSSPRFVPEVEPFLQMPLRKATR